MLNQFKKEVLDGLSKTPQKSLPSKYFYDKKGDDLFVQIMALPEYYLTRSEMEIFQEKTEDIISALSLNKENKYSLIELGAGDGTKTVHLLKALVNKNINFEYFPVDISQNALDGIKSYLRTEVPTLIVKPNHNDYFKALENLKQDGTIKIILFLGSNIGNLVDELATEFIYQLGSNLFKGDKIILGVDLKKPKAIVLPAYNDSKGVTAEFNLNLLDRINKELGANFNRAQFEHAPTYDEHIGIAKSYIKSKIKQSVIIDGIEFYFEKDELIQNMNQSATIEEKKEEEEIHVEIPKAEEIGTSLGDLFKGLKLD